MASLNEPRNTHRSGAAIPDVVLFSTTGNWDSLYLTMKDYLQHMSSGVEHLSSYKNSVVFIFIVDFGFGGRQPSKSNYLKMLKGKFSHLSCISINISDLSP